MYDGCILFDECAAHTKIARQHLIVNLQGNLRCGILQGQSQLACPWRSGMNQHVMTAKL
jgi:hypothetical protein